MDIPIANEIDNKLYINNAKLQEIIYYDPESNTYSNVELKKKLLLYINYNNHINIFLHFCYII